MPAELIDDSGWSFSLLSDLPDGSTTQHGEDHQLLEQDEVIENEKLDIELW